MPQDCSKWDTNAVYSNNENYFTNDRDAYCKNTPFEKRPKTIVCPQFQVPVGSGFILYGVNENLISNNNIYDNWRSGVRLFWVPATIRGENDPAKQIDTSNGNKFIRNQLGYDAGRRQPNGVDFFWDENGRRQLLGGQLRARRQGHQRPGRRCRRARAGSLLHRATWPSSPPRRRARRGIRDDNPDPPGCTWFTTPPKPSQ